jgi:hypothetical protein
MNTFLSTAVLALIVSTNAVASSDFVSTWYCKGPKETNIRILVKGERAIYINAHEVENPVMTVDANKKNVFYHSEGGDCSNQIVGYTERVFIFTEAKSKMGYEWCDDDGESGQGEYELSCAIIE